MKPRVLLFFCTLILASLACSALTGGDSPADANPPSDSSGGEATQAVQPPPGSGETSPGSGEETAPGSGIANAGAETIDLNQANLYQAPLIHSTFYTSIEYTFTQINATSPVSGSMHLDGRTQNEPFAATMVIETHSDAVLGNAGVITATQIADTHYIVFSEGGCISGPIGQEEDPYDALLDTGGLLTGQAHRIRPDEQINGIDTYVYELTMENIDPLDPAGIGVQELDQARLYIAKDGGFIVRLLIDGKGTTEVLSGDTTLVGQVHYQLDYYDFDEPVEIQAPEQCAQTGDLEYPIPDDAQNVTNFAGIISFSTGLSMNDTADFYETEMAALGCSEPEKLSSETGVILTYDDCPNGPVQIIISPDADGAGSSVTIFAQPE